MRLKNTFALVLLSAIYPQIAFSTDIAAGQKKAMLCISCHGAQGVSMSPLWPNLAGQKAAYTEKQLKAFRSGERKDPLMEPMAKPLSDADIKNLSAYYESLK